MPDVGDSDAILEYAIENLEWIADERRDTHAWPVFDLRRAEWVSADTVN
jgi:hypothetical protein